MADQMADLKLEHENGHFILELVTQRATDWMDDHLDIYSSYSIGDRVQFPLLVEDMILHEVQDLGMTIDS